MVEENRLGGSIEVTFEPMPKSAFLPVQLRTY